VTDDFSHGPIEGKEAAKIRRMHHEWEQFKNDHVGALTQVSWVVRNWKLIAFAAVLGAAGSFKSLMEGLKSWW